MSRKGVARDEVTVELIVVEEELLEVDPLLNAFGKFT